ncbi:hypothetical protein JCM17844_11280 [Iodidimonas gelatinilytica]|uniref:Uncharacterized protein n=1 Tax=Iodidimonas gelatinilytica TaxID=1236966 RepID=A0A5A7MNJ3_9PROT|nr:hypothetical protein JCM17844_11280 [Iodidimonas gelatinilytica]
MTVAQSDRIYFENADQLKERQIMAENETNGGAQARHKISKPHKQDRQPPCWRNM